MPHTEPVPASPPRWRRLQITNPGPVGPIGREMAGCETDLVDGRALASLLDMVLGVTAGAFKAQRAREKTLEARIADLEARPAGGVEYAGTFKDGTIYQPGQLVTRGGSLWLCLRQTMVTPGAGPTFWRLVVKEGQAR